MSYAAHPYGSSNPSISSKDSAGDGSSFFQKIGTGIDDFFTTGWPGQPGTVDHTNDLWNSVTGGSSGGGITGFLNSWTFLVIALIVAALIFFKHA